MSDLVISNLQTFSGLPNRKSVFVRLTGDRFFSQSVTTQHSLQGDSRVQDALHIILGGEQVRLSRLFTNNVSKMVEISNTVDRFQTLWLTSLHFLELMSQRGGLLDNVHLTVRKSDGTTKQYQIDLNDIIERLRSVREIADNTKPDIFEKTDEPEEPEEPEQSIKESHTSPKEPVNYDERSDSESEGSESESEGSEWGPESEGSDSDLDDDIVVKEVHDVLDNTNAAKDAGQLERERRRRVLWNHGIKISLQNNMRVFSMIVDRSLELAGVECSSDGTNVAVAAVIARIAYPNDSKPPPTKIEQFLSSSRIGTDNLMRLAFWTLVAEQMEKDEVLAPSVRPSMNRWPSCVECEHRNRRSYDVATVRINGSDRIRPPVEKLCGCINCRMFFGPQQQRSGHLYVRVIWTGHHLGFYIDPNEKRVTETGLNCFLRHLTANINKQYSEGLRVHQLFPTGLTLETLRNKVLRFSTSDCRTCSVLSPLCTQSQWDDVLHAVVSEPLEDLKGRPDGMATFVVGIEEDNTSARDIELTVQFSILGEHETRTLHGGHGQTLMQVLVEHNLHKIIQVNEEFDQEWLAHAPLSVTVERPVLDLRPHQINVLKMDDFVHLASEDEFKRELLYKLGLTAPETPRRLTTVNGVAFSSEEDMWKFFFHELIRERGFSMSGLRAVTECVYTECSSKSALHQRCIDQIRRSKLIVPFVQHQFLPKNFLRGYLPNGCSWLRQIDMNLIFPCRRSEQDGFMTLGMVLKEFLTTNWEQMPHGMTYGFLKNSLTNRLQPLAEGVFYVHIGKEEPTLSFYGENTWNGEDTIQPTYDVNGEQLSREEYLPLTRAFETKEAFVLAKSGWSEAVELVRKHATFGLRSHLPPIGPSTKSLSEWKGLMLNTENGWRRGGSNNHRWQCIRIPLGERPPARQDGEDTFHYASRIFDQLNRYLWKRVDTEPELFDAYVERKEHELNETLVGKSQKQTLRARVAKSLDSESKNKLTFMKALHDEFKRRLNSRLSVIEPLPPRRRKAKQVAAEASPLPLKKKAKIGAQDLADMPEEEGASSSSKKRPLERDGLQDLVMPEEGASKRRRLEIGTYLFGDNTVVLEEIIEHSRVRIRDFNGKQMFLSRERFDKNATLCVDLTYN